MGAYNFKTDLIDSEEIVNNFKTLLDNLGYKTIKAEGYFPDWDVSAESPTSGKVLTFELKSDYMSDRTGNIAIEYESRGKESGINVTKADCWVHYFEGKYHVVMVKTLKEKLHEFAFRDVIGGDVDSNTKMLLIKTKKFKEICIMII